MSDPNTFDKEIKDANNANPEAPTIEGAEGENTPIKPTPDADPVIDYEKKFSESSKEALRIREENKKLQEALAEKERLLSEKGSQQDAGEITENLYPGFEELDPEAQKNLINFTNSITKKAQDSILKDPAIAFARQNYNEKKWDSAFAEVLQERPELAQRKDEFKAKYFKANNVPDNIKDILGDVAKIYLFDQAKDIGARETEEKSKRIDLERATGGDKTPPASRSLSDWQRMAQENPAKFAALAKEYNADLSAGKLKE